MLARGWVAVVAQMEILLMRLALSVRFLAFAALLVPLSTQHAQAQADFYKGKTVDLMIGYSVGGGYDVYARLIARHLGKHIPGNPIVTPKNMEGAGSLRLANWLYNVGAKDGSAFGIIGRGTGFDPLLGHKGAQFDATKYTWIGSANDEVSICVAWHTSGITKFEDLLSRELTVGGTGASGNGTRIGGPANWEEFTNWQWVTIKDKPNPYPF